MHLLGWIHPLPKWIIEAVLEGKLQVVDTTDKKGLVYLQYLKGTVTNPEGTVIEFQ